MKRKFLIILPLCCMMIGACNHATTETEVKATVEEEQNLFEADDENILIWTDEETGVQYIIYSYKSGYGGMGGITPRVNALGNVMTETR